MAHASRAGGLRNAGSIEPEGGALAAQFVVSTLHSGSIDLGATGIGDTLVVTQNGTGERMHRYAVDPRRSAGRALIPNDGQILGGIGQYTGSGGVGVVLNAGTLPNTGTIAGDAGDVGQGTSAFGDAVRSGSQAATLSVTAGAVFQGSVVENDSVSEQIVLAGSTAGTLSGLGTQFTGIARTAIAPGADWTLTGSNRVVAGTTLAVAGSLAVAGTLNVIGTVSGSATVSGHALVLSGAVASGLALTAGGSALIAAGGTLGDATLADGGRVVSGDNSPGFTVAGFGLGDTIDLRGLAYNAAGSATLGGLTLTVAEGGQDGHIQFAAGSSFVGLGWVTKADPLGGTEITLKSV